MATADEILTVLAHLALVYRRDDVGLELAKHWSPYFAEEPADLLAEAARAYVETGGDYFPSPRQLRSHLPTYLDGESAWIEVRKQIRAVGFYGTPTWSCPDVGEAMEGIGWEALCGMEQDQVGVFHAQYVRAYEAVRRRARALSALEGQGGSQRLLEGL